MGFKKITAIIRPERLEKVEARLKELGVPGISVNKVKGYGEYANFYESDWMLPHVHLVLFVEQGQVDGTVGAIMEAAYTGLDGDGLVAVEPVESLYHIRSKRRCKDRTC